MVPNHPTHDPDIQHLPFFAISKNFLNNLYSSYYRRIMLFDAFATVVLRFQHILYYLVMSLARFNLYANSYSFLYRRAFESRNARGGKWTLYLEVAAIGLFWTWYCLLLVRIGNLKDIIGFILVSHMVTGPLHIQVRHLIFEAVGCFLKMIRLCCRILHVRRRILDPRSHSSIANYERLPTSYVPILSRSSMVVSTSK